MDTRGYKVPEGSKGSNRSNREGMELLFVTCEAIIAANIVELFVACGAFVVALDCRSCCCHCCIKVSCWLGSAAESNPPGPCIFKGDPCHMASRA